MLPLGFIVTALLDAEVDEHGCIRITTEARDDIVLTLVKQIEINKRREQADEDRVS